MPAIALSILGAVALGAALGLPVLAPAPATAQTAEERAAIRAANDLSLAFEWASRQIAASVVNIESTARVDADRGRPRQFDLENPFGWLLPGPDEEGDGEEDRFRRERRGQGSGIVARADGLILTNNHVVADADEIRVTLRSGREYDAEVVGVDRETDLAVIRIDTDGLTPARFGASADLRVGQWVVAVGTPFGLEQTVTAGIISATGRDNLGIASYENFIQTDAAINPGNSGGPLVNLQGEVIGLNTAISTRTGSYEGIGFAIPSDMARSVMESIIDEGRVVRGWLGVTIRPVDEEVAEEVGYPSTEGVFISEVTPEGPSDEAGLRVQDIVVELNGRRMTEPNDLRNRIAAIRPGNDVKLRVFREGRERTITVRLGERPGMEEIAAMLRGNYFRTLGISVITVTEELAERIGTERRGVIVTSVTPESPAARVGLEIGDIIMEFEDRRIENVEDLRRALRVFDPDSGMRLRVEREGDIYLLMK
jgi:serine protease Do